MELHRAYAAEWGISPDELERERPHPATGGNTDFLLRTAALGDFAELVAALLPCMWSYSELGQGLAENAQSTDDRYTRWIQMYSDEEFATLARGVARYVTRLPREPEARPGTACGEHSSTAAVTNSSSGTRPGAPSRWSNWRTGCEGCSQEGVIGRAR